VFTCLGRLASREVLYTHREAQTRVFRRIRAGVFGCLEGFRRVNTNYDSLFWRIRKNPIVTVEGPSWHNSTVTAPQATIHKEPLHYTSAVAHRTYS